MKYSRVLALTAILALFLPLTASAKSKNEGNMQLTDPVQIGSTQLKPGSYKVEWSGNGPAVKVNFLKDNKTVATTKGKIVNRKQASPYDDVVLGPTANNQKTIDEIDFSNRKEALLITPNTMAKSHK